MCNFIYKKVCAVLTVVLFSVTLFGCAADGKPDSTAATTTTALSAFSTTAADATTALVPVTTAENITTAAKRPTEDTITVSFDSYHFSMTLPASWEGAYATAETSRGVVFYELQNHLYNARGKLFSIFFIAEGEYREGMYPSYYNLGVYEGNHAIWLNVTDVQYEESLKAPYQTLFDQLDIVREGFVYIS